MTPPIFQTVAASPTVTALIGTNPVRFFLFGRAPQNVIKPYAVWRTAFGTPENYLATRPDADAVTTQIDIYTSPAQGAALASQIANAIRDALEPVAYITNWRGESRDPETDNFNIGFDVDWIVDR